jgi:hypothetical protein
MKRIFAAASFAVLAVTAPETRAERLLSVSEAVVADNDWRGDF